MRFRSLTFHALLPALVALLVAAPLHGQTVRTRGYGEPDLDTVLRDAIAKRVLLITRDTVISARDTVRGDVLVLSARFIVDGALDGNLTGVEANMYIRPNANITGRVTNVAGGYYPSELARVHAVEDRPLAPYTVLKDGETWVIQGTVKRPKLSMLGGVQLPEYNRVDGLRVEVGPRILLPPFAGVEPSVSGSIGYATERKEVLGRAELRLRRARSTLAFGWEDDITRTNDAWVRSQLNNSLSTIFNGKDYRNYYQADRAWVEFRRILERGQRESQYWIRGQNELANPLAAGDPFILFKPDSIRSNPIIPSSRVTSAFLGLQTKWAGATSIWNLSGEVEVAGKVMGADEAYNAYAVSGLYAFRAIANHTLEIETTFRGPLPGTETLPQQRWNIVGGSGTLYTYDVAQFRGDRLVFVETEYTIPFAQQFTLPVLGAPRIKLMHNVGMAWTHDDKRSFEQNVGVRLQVALAYARYVVDPRTGEGKFSANVSLPSKGYPWEKANRPTTRQVKPK
jgi:hypothetical protein